MARRFTPTLTYKLCDVPIKQIKVWHEAQARKLDRDNIAELAKSIRADGLLNPPLVQRVSANEYLLLAGQRRLAAMKRLGAKTIPVHVIPKKDAITIEQAKASSVVENIHRNKMDSSDIVEAATILTEQLGKKEAAKRLGITLPTLYKYIGYAAVPDILKGMVPSVISRADMTRLYQIKPNVKMAAAIAENISGLDPQLRKEYLKLLAKHENWHYQKLLAEAKNSMIRQNVTVRLSKSAARKLQRIADKNNTKYDTMAGILLKKYLR